jgi:peroxiredoxin
MQRILWLAALAVFSGPVPRAYRITGTTDIQTGYAILNDHRHPDTARITNGRFEFQGTASGPVSALIGIEPSGSIPAPLVVEPGEITVTFKGGDYTIGGSRDNVRLQRLQDQLQPYRTRAERLRAQAYQVRGPEQAKLLDSVAGLNKERIARAAALVKTDTGFAGFMEMLSVYRSETAGPIAQYLETFRGFADDPGYQRVKAYYDDMPRADVGLVAPDFTLPDESGNRVRLSAFRGSYVLVDFWYHNCPFCRKMNPLLSKIYADLKPKGFEIVSISIDAKVLEPEWRQAIREDGSTWTELWDNEITVPPQYGVSGYPTMFLLDKQGKVLQKLVGFIEEANLRKLLVSYIQ